MPKYYCDYCDAFLTHDSPSVRKTHNGGRKHKVIDNLTNSPNKENVRMYYQAWMEEQAQKLIDATTRAFTSQRMLNPAAPGFAPPAMPSMPPRATFNPMNMVRPPMLPPVGGFFAPPVGGMPPTVTTAHQMAGMIAPPLAPQAAPSTNGAGGMPPLRTSFKQQPQD